MQLRVRLLILSLSCLCFSGCSTYHGFVNGFSPSKPQWRMDIGQGRHLSSEGMGYVCEMPASREVYMVMPEEGKLGTVVVMTKDGREIVLEGDYSTMVASAKGERVYTATQEEMEATFGNVIEVLPKAPLHEVLYFLTGTDKLVSTSEQKANSIYTDIVSRQAVEIIITGHTDTVGSVESNRKLSFKRANAIKSRLVSYGAEAQSITVFGKGEAQLAVGTEDNVAEPANRRVDIQLR